MGINLEKRNSPKQGRSKELVGFLLKATALGISKFGIDKLSTRKISKLAGVSVGSYYQYFPNKESLFLRLAESIMEGTKSKFDELLLELKEEKSIEGKTNKAVNAMCDHYLENAPYLKDLMKIVVTFEKHKLVMAIRNRTTLKISEVLEEEFNMSSSEAKIKSYIIFNSFVGVLHTYILSEEPLITESEVRQGLVLSISATIQKELHC